MPLAGNFMDPVWLFQTLGPWFLLVSALIIFTECAIFPILPGDSLLFAVGMFIAQAAGIRLFGLDQVGTLLLALLILLVAAVLGNIVGYWVGLRLSPWLFKPRTGFIGKIFSQKHLAETHLFFERYGSRALVLGRFVPFVRTFVTMVAGAAGMTFRSFITWTGFGAVIWAVGVTLLGYFLGDLPIVRDNLEIALILIVVVSVIPMIVEILVQRARRRAEADAPQA
ncbi:membrane-associated protein [Propionicimonas paludicola]|uniref:Membrane-associated protein n=1 Tax=Propionicimonas paludicola TaxID=185243 RepID=A0A2A9CPW1_9ACTN|nr:VTT domain-containing protein [Propionicimonas paludicola]PFG15700.1 membrane-associated protein [Propionicimonas paludicola]